MKLFGNFIVSMLFLLNAVAFGQNNSDYINLWPVQKQIKQKRVFKEISKIDEIVLDDIGIYGPFILDADNNENLVLYESVGGKKQIVYLSASNRYKDPVFIGKGIGGGPEEFRSPKDVKFDRKGHIWVADPKQARISIWKNDGSLIRTMSLDHLLPAVIALQKNVFFTMPMLIKEDKIIYKMDKKGREITSFQSLPADKYRSPLYYEGHFALDNTGLYYAGLPWGFIRKYNPTDGQLIYSRATIIPIYLRPLKRKQVSTHAVATSRSKNTRYATRDIEVSNKKIYLLFSGTKYTVCRYVDVYNTKKGDYLYSFKLPAYAKAIALSRGKLFVLQRYFNNDNKTNSIAIYQISGNN